MLRRPFPLLRTVVLATFNEGCCEYMLWACCERVANAVTCNIQHHESFFPPSPCCDHVATILWPCCDPWCLQHPTWGALLPLLLDTKPNITCLQHWNWTSATLIITICNSLQHQDSTSTTSKNLDLILKHLHGTLAACQDHRCNMCTTSCNINEKRLHHKDDRLQHVKNIITTSIYNNYNIKNPKKEEAHVRLAVAGRRARMPHTGLRPW
jgi:hypothetical protein